MLLLPKGSITFYPSKINTFLLNKKALQPSKTVEIFLSFFYFINDSQTCIFLSFYFFTSFLRFVALIGLTEDSFCTPPQGKVRLLYFQSCIFMPSKVLFKSKMPSLTKVKPSKSVFHHENYELSGVLLPNKVYQSLMFQLYITIGIPHRVISQT